MATEYQLRRATDSNFTQNVTDISAGIDTISYLDTGLSSGATYFYKLRKRVDGGEWSIYSNIVSATTVGGESGEQFNWNTGNQWYWDEDNVFNW